MIVLTSENQGCAYSICSEGALYYTPMYKDGSINVEDWSEVDLMSLLGEDENLRLEVDQIHEQLIAMSKAIGEYFQKWNLKSSCTLVAKFSQRKFMPVHIVTQEKQQRQEILGQKW